MKLTGYIIEDCNEMPWAYTCKRLIEEADKQGDDLRLIGVHQTYLDNDGVYNRGEKLVKRDYAINRYKWNNVKDYVHKLCKLTYNRTDAFNIYVSKFEQLSRLGLKSVRMPAYLLATAFLDHSFITEKLGLPFVAKGLCSSMGREVFLIENEEDQKKLLTKFGEDREWLFEEYIAAAKGRDMRLFSVRGEVIACMERRSEGDFRANVALGAKVYPLAAEGFMRDAAVEIYEKTGLDFLGIDLLYGDDAPVFCEINVMPGIKGMEEATGVNVAGAMIRTIREDFFR